MGIHARSLRRHSFRDGQRGQAFSQVAFATPLIVLFLVGSIEFGHYMDLSSEVDGAARAAVQYASQSTAAAADTAGILAAAQGDSSEDADSVTVTPTTYCVSPDGMQADCGSSRDRSANHMVEYVKVAANESFSSILDLVGIPPPITVSATAVMRVQ